jgi:four helix bundle protein
MEIVGEVYRVTRLFPREEIYGLSAQSRRAAISLPSNISEGHARQSTREYLQHVSIALGSLAELETQILVAVRLGYLDPKGVEPLLALADSLGKMLHGLQKSLRNKLSPSP